MATDVMGIRKGKRMLEDRCQLRFVSLPVLPSFLESTPHPVQPSPVGQGQQPKGIVKNMRHDTMRAIHHSAFECDPFDSFSHGHYSCHHTNRMR